MINEASAYAQNQIKENYNNQGAYFQASNPAEVKLMKTEEGKSGEFNSETDSKAKERIKQIIQAMQKDKPAAKEYMQKMLDQVNSALYGFDKGLRFEIDKETDDLVVKVVNSKTGEAIRQYPTEEVLALREKLLAGETQSMEAEG